MDEHCFVRQHRMRPITKQWIASLCGRYLFKGADNANAAIHAISKIYDKIGDYQEKRYLGAAEALWRLYTYLVHDLTDAVIRMKVERPEERCGANAYPDTRV